MTANKKSNLSLKQCVVLISLKFQPTLHLSKPASTVVIINCFKDSLVCENIFEMFIERFEN